MKRVGVCLLVYCVLLPCACVLIACGIIKLIEKNTSDHLWPDNTQYMSCEWFENENWIYDSEWLNGYYEIVGDSDTLKVVKNFIPTLERDAEGCTVWSICFDTTFCDK